MTGLEPGRHVIVEIATLITDDDLELVAEGPDLVVHATDAQLAEMDTVVVDMHTRSGLLEQIKTSTLTLEEAGAQTLAFLKEHIPEARTVPLCGNSIGTDRRFLAAVPARDRGLPALPLHRRVHGEGARPSLATRHRVQGAQQGGRPPRHGRHQGEPRRAPHYRDAFFLLPTSESAEGPET